ncbi:MAG: hypothetical protein ACFFCW_10960 [Candidatus Hodarchaeota archaeon]
MAKLKVLLLHAKNYIPFYRTRFAYAAFEREKVEWVAGLRYEGQGPIGLLSKLTGPLWVNFFRKRFATGSIHLGTGPRGPWQNGLLLEQ